MPAIPYMPLYIADYMADAAHLTTLEHGAYLLLIMNYWQRGKPLPNDDDKLSKIVKLRIDKWKKMRNVIIEFFSVTETEWRHIRIDKELENFREKSEKARLAGIKSGQKRREKSLTIDERTLNGRSTDVERMVNHTDTDTYTDRTDEEKKEKILKKKKANAAQLSELEKAFEIFWLSYPNKKDKQDAKKAYLRIQPDAELQEKILLGVEAQIAEREIKAKHNVWVPQWKMAATWLNKKSWENAIAEESQIAQEAKLTGGTRYEKRQSKVDMHAEACAGAFAGLPDDFFDNGEFNVVTTAERVD